MSRSLEEIQQIVLRALGDHPRDVVGNAWVSGRELGQLTGLSPAEINDAVSLLRRSGHVDMQTAFGTTPFNFESVNITATGRYELERARRIDTRPDQEQLRSAKKNEVEKLPSEAEYDVFICHASEDKNEVAEPLAKLLIDRDLRVWYDRFTLKIGDSLREMIDYGLARSRWGIVILSPSFFKKNWPQKELNGLAAREDSEGRKVILPVWHQVDRDYVVKYSPILADRLASRTADGLPIVLKELMEVISPAEASAPTPSTTLSPDIKESLEGFSLDHPKTEQTGFIMMRFGRTNTHKRILGTIKSTLYSHGLSALRADDRQYHHSLFLNTLTYIYGCSFGVAVFERIDDEEFNPNVSLEVGYMLALGKPVCLLKDRTIARLPADLLGQTYVEFDFSKPEETIPRQLTKWLADKQIMQQPQSNKGR